MTAPSIHRTPAPAWLHEGARVAVYFQNWPNPATARVVTVEHVDHVSSRVTDGGAFSTPMQRRGDGTVLLPLDDPRVVAVLGVTV